MDDLDLFGGDTVTFDVAPEPTDKRWAEVQLSYDSYSTCCDVGDRMSALISGSDNLDELEHAERALRDAVGRIELRLSEIAARKVALTTVPLVSVAA